MKKIKSSAPEALKAAIKGSSKTGNIELAKTKPFSILGEIFRKRKYIYPVIACGQNPNQTNQVALIDLYFDPKKTLCCNNPPKLSKLIPHQDFY